MSQNPGSQNTHLNSLVPDQSSQVSESSSDNSENHPSSNVSVTPSSFVSIPPSSFVSIPPSSFVSIPPSSFVSIPPSSFVSIPPSSFVSIPPSSSVNTTPSSSVSMIPSSRPSLNRPPARSSADNINRPRPPPILNLQDPRQPQSLQDLLQLSTSLQSASNAYPQDYLTEERAEFLRNALNDMTTNLVPEMQNRLDILKEIPTKPENVVEANLRKYEETMEQLVEYLYEIDLARVFYQVNGQEVIAPLLRSKHACLRSSAASLILECCQNNPFCQELSAKDEIFGPLIEMATSDTNKDAMYKAIAAVSAITRSNPVGIIQFNKYNGTHMVEKALNSGIEKIVNKTVFLVMGLCDTDETLKKNLTESGVVVTLMTLLRLSDNLVKEYMLRALLSVVKDNPTAQQICRQHDLPTYLKSLCHRNTESEYQDLVECATNLQKLLL